MLFRSEVVFDGELSGSGVGVEVDSCRSTVPSALMIVRSTDIDIFADISISTETIAFVCSGS